MSVFTSLPAASTKCANPARVPLSIFLAYTNDHILSSKSPIGGSGGRGGGGRRRGSVASLTSFICDGEA